MPQRRLLVLDDDPLIGRTIQFIAQGVGLAARYTHDPGEFFAVLAEWEPTHVALDLVMPGMDGVEVLVQLAQRNCRARIIITSGMGGRVLDAAGRSGVEHGLDILGVLPKPFSASMLRALLDQAPGTAMAELPALARGNPIDGAYSRPTGEISAEAMSRALEDRQFSVVYQPKVVCDGGMLAGFEVLARWHHPTLGEIPPDRFIAVAERHDLIDELTAQVLDQSLQWFARHAPESRPPALGDPVTLSVNLSARSLRSHQLVETLTSRCQAHGVDPSRIVLELTETSAMEDPVASLDMLTRLRMKGFNLSLDDFGTGYSSMLQLVRLPFSEIKIDKSFVMEATRSGEARSVIRSIVDLGHSLGLQVTAEGVETAETLHYLQDTRCDLAQGFHIARLMPGERALLWLQRHTEKFANPSRG
ncbi:MAG: EAL domain-containing protein [Rehaibacterium terrae]|uniref:EAL domain-containing response regulator n=1 Tax=Rehaibacterium terrae TaxID=1341696 RepID=UPI00391D7614